ncbi:MAG: hypothetical protein O3A39_06865 [Proteobacteria bacterium]|nr:hypothetical protein [Pseudomonadota bacterium]
MPQQTEVYNATVKGVKDIHNDESPVKYWLSVELDDRTERRLYVEQNCRHIQKGQRVKVTGLPIKKAGSNNQTCVSVESEGGETMQQTNVSPKVNGVSNISNRSDVWKEKYRLTMSNLLSAAIQSGKEVSFDQIDKYVRMILSAEYDGDEAPPF